MFCTDHNRQLEAVVKRCLFTKSLCLLLLTGSWKKSTEVHSHAVIVIVLSLPKVGRISIFLIAIVMMIIIRTWAWNRRAQCKQSVRATWNRRAQCKQSVRATWNRRAQCKQSVRATWKRYSTCYCCCCGYTGALPSLDEGNEVDKLNVKSRDKARHEIRSLLSALY